MASTEPLLEGAVSGGGRCSRTGRTVGLLLGGLLLLAAPFAGLASARGFFQKPRFISDGTWQVSALPDDMGESGQEGSAMGTIHRVAAAVRHLRANIGGPVRIMMPPEYADVLPVGSSWDTMEGFRAAASRPSSFSLVGKSGSTRCAANLSFVWQAHGQFNGQGGYITDATVVVNAATASPFYALTLKAHFGKGRVDHGVAVLPAYAHAKCQGLWQATHTYFHGLLFGNGSFMLVTNVTAGRIVDLYGWVLMAPAPLRSTLPRHYRDPNLTIDLFEQYVSAAVAFTMDPVANSTRRLAPPFSSKRTGALTTFLGGFSWSDIPPKVVLDVIVNVGKWAWSVLHGSVDISQPDDYATGLPEGVGHDDWMLMDGWYDHEEIWHGGAQNGFGPLASFWLRARQDCRGQYNGQGSYINNMQVHFFKVEQGLPWVSIQGRVKIGEPVNAGTLDDPIASIPFQVFFHYESLFFDQIDTWDGAALGTCKFGGRLQWQ